MEDKELVMSDVIGVAIERWPAEKIDAAVKWLHDTYGGADYPNWYVDYQHMCTDLVMRKDIYFMFLVRFGQDYATS